MTDGRDDQDSENQDSENQHSDDQDDEETPTQAIGSCAASHESLVGHLRELSVVDPLTPSALPNWTIGHVMSHIARNGDSILDMLAGRPQYPTVESRNADIEQGSSRAWADLVADVASTAAAVDRAFATHDDWSATAITMGGERPCTALPLMRQREVEVHRVDLASGYGFSDMPREYVRRDLRMLEMVWSARKPMGMTALPDAALAVDPATRLAWMMGRVDIVGLDPAGLF